MSEFYRRCFDVSVAAWTLGVEASAVVAMRTAKVLLCGDLSGQEARLMVSEKWLAAYELQTALLFGQLGTDPVAAAREVVGSYTRKVRANRRRLSSRPLRVQTR